MAWDDAGDAPPERGIDRAGWIALGVGLVLAFLTEALPFLRVLVGYFVVLAHEMGHALAGWLFGQPSIPAFDFTYGGGVTSHLQRSPVLVALVYAALGFLAWIFRRNAASLALTLGLAAGYTALLLTSGAEVFTIAWGHGGELLIATLFLHRAASGRAVQLAAERPLYAWLGLHIVFHDLRFSWGLCTSDFAREVYAEAKGGGHWMDFSRLANEYFGTSLEGVAGVFLVLCLLAPLVGLAPSFLRPELAALRERLGRV